MEIKWSSSNVGKPIGKEEDDGIVIIIGEERVFGKTTNVKTCVRLLIGLGCAVEIGTILYGMMTTCSTESSVVFRGESRQYCTVLECTVVSECCRRRTEDCVGKKKRWFEL
mmetsp:Transcript_12848/g.19928  ORF Transcript_12848/g.19928 Transcript_12848/m.19928 type:complete len:111 (-) Transcript_12848:49-381(-)